MTIPAAFPLAASSINLELRRSAGAAFDIQGATERWLSGVPSGATSFSDFLSKTAVKQVAAVGPSAIGTSHSFLATSFGPDFVGRNLMIQIFAMDRNATWPATVSVTNLVVGNDGSAAANGFWFFQGNAPTTAVGIQQQLVAPTGTSGDITFTTTQNTRCYVVVLAIANANSYSNSSTDGAFSNGLSLPITLNTVAANGILIGAAIKQGGNGTPTMAFTGMNTIGTANPVGSYFLGWGFSNRQASASNIVVTATAAGGEGGGTQTGFATIVDALT